MFWQTRSFHQIALLGALLITLAACGRSSDSNTTPAPQSPVTGGTTGSQLVASLSDYTIQLSSSTVPATQTNFSLVNASQSGQRHEFVILKTDLAAYKLPMSANNTVDESQLAKVGEQEGTEVGRPISMSADLAAGHYVIICNLPGHYAQGMRADLTATK